VTGAWLPDPTRAHRLRYWDGSQWTEHVSENGGVDTDPIVGPPPPPPAPAPVPAPPVVEAAVVQTVVAPVETALAPASEVVPAPEGPAKGGVYPVTILGRIGFGIAAVGGVLTAATAGATAVNQGDFGRIEVAGGSWIGVVAAVLCVAAAAAPWPWARVTGVGVSSFFAILVAFALVGFRTSEDLLPGEDVTLDTAGWLMLFSSLLLFAGTAVALVGLRKPARGPDPTASPREGKSVAALVLGIVGFILPFLSAPAVAFALFAMDDHTATGGRVGKRGLAITGLVLGVVSLGIWALGLTAAMKLSQP